MPHSSFKSKVIDNGAGVGRCPCGQTFECASEQELAMKHRMHHRFCSNSPVAFLSVIYPISCSALLVIVFFTGL